jgi:hypothetical protein
MRRSVLSERLTRCVILLVASDADRIVEQF